MSESKEENSTPAADVKEEEKAPKTEENKTQDESSKDSEKDSAKEDSVKEESEKGSGKEDSDEEEVGLLDRPVEVYGCRARKQVERLEISFTSKEKQIDIPEGKGDKLTDCPRIEFHIAKTKLNDLKQLHKILFSRVGSGPEIKKNIRKFCGFTFSKDSTEYDKKKASIEKFPLAALKKVCEILDVERKGTKEDIVKRLLEFLLQPKDSGKKVPKAKQSSKDKKKPAEKKTTKKGKSKKEVLSGDDSNSADGSASEQLNDDDDEEMEAEDEEDKDKNDEKDDSDSDEDVTPKKTKTPAKGKKTPAKAAVKKTEKKEKPKKEEKKTSKATKRKRDDDSSEHSDEEPSSKKAKMPTDDEIKKLVKRILDAADLQEITMKKVIKQVSDAYPDSDLSHKKAFIKSTIKSVIS